MPSERVAERDSGALRTVTGAGGRLLAMIRRRPFLNRAQTEDVSSSTPDASKADCVARYAASWVLNSAGVAAVLCRLLDFASTASSTARVPTTGVPPPSPPPPPHPARTNAGRMDATRANG